MKVVVFESAKEKIWCSGANIYMLGLSTHAWKVNFCKFTNETRNGLEDSSRHEGLKSLAAVTGACAGGGYELALACDRIVMVDDRSSTVSLPEVPLLGVLPGTGGLTRVTDKRKVRRDLADIFCTTSEGVRADRAKDWKLIDAHAKPQQFPQLVAAEVAALRAQSTRAGAAQGIELTPLERQRSTSRATTTARCDAQIDRAARIATITVKAPQPAIESTPEAIEAAGANWWPLQAGARAGRRHPEPAHQRTGNRHLGDQDPRRRQPGDAGRRRAGAAQGPLAGARDASARCAARWPAST